MTNYVINDAAARQMQPCMALLKLNDGSTVVVSFRRMYRGDPVTWTIESDSRGDWGTLAHRSYRWNLSYIADPWNHSTTRSGNLYGALARFLLEMGVMNDVDKP